MSHGHVRRLKRQRRKLEHRPKPAIENVLPAPPKLSELLPKVAQELEKSPMQLAIEENQKASVS